MLSAESQNILAICVVSTVLAAVAGWIVLLLGRSPFTPPQSILYAVNYAVVRVFWRVRIDGRLPIPPDRGAVIICNHRCPLDPSFIAATTLRVVHWMVAKEYCEHPAFRWLLKQCEVIPIRRGGVDMAAIREAIRLVRQGELVGIFPEGRINTTTQLLLPCRAGAAMIGLKARAPVVPCYIDGAPYDGTTLGCLLMPASVRLKIGRPIDLSAYFDREDRRDVQDELSRRFQDEIARLSGQIGVTFGTAGTKRSCRSRCDTRQRRSAGGPR